MKAKNTKGKSSTKCRPAKSVTYAAITEAQYHAFQEAFDFFNAELFDGSLPQLLVTLQRKGSTQGYFSPDRFVGRANGAKTHELALNPDHFTGRSDEAILSTLVHEMVHLWQQAHGHPPRRGYHDRQFARMMKIIGLHPSDTGAVGGRETGQHMSHFVIAGGPFSEAYAKLAKRGLKLHWESQPPIRSQRNSKTKHTCPRCGRNAWAIPEPEYVDCHRCGVPMIPQPNVAYATNAA